MMLLFSKRLWLAKGKLGRGKPQASSLEGDPLLTFYPNIGGWQGLGGHRMPPFCSQLVGVGMGWSYH